MAIYDEAFCFYGRLNIPGVLLELQGSAFDSAPHARDPLIGQKFYQAFFWQGDPHTSVSHTPAIIKSAIEEAALDKTVVIETDFHLHSESPQKLKLHFTPVKDSAGQIYELSFSALDITTYSNEAAFYKERSEQLLYAAETAEIGLFFWDLSKEDIFSTPRTNELFGLTSDDILNYQKISSVVHPDDWEAKHGALQRSQINFEEYNTEYRVIVNGEVRWLWVRGKTFPGIGDSSPFMMGSARDITRDKLAEAELAKIYGLEKQARDDVERAIQAKDQFIAMVSHELRAPLNSILGWVKILLTKEINQETRITALETIERSARVQAKLIGDLVDSSKIISGKLNLEFHPVDLTEAVAFVVESQRPVAQAKHIEVQYLNRKERIKVRADLARLQQIFTNLVANAIKFTPDGGKITIEFKRNHDDICVSIKDTGKGINAAELPFIFERYFQAKVNESEDKSGLGLGLSIVSSLVRQHGGVVKAESEGSGKGAVFSVILPILQMDGEATNLKAEPAVSRNDSLEKISILLVEDNDDSREMLEIYLQQMGAEVTAVSSAAAAIESLASNGTLPDVLLSDISMPVEDGYSLINKVRNLPMNRGGNLPAIALTALTSAEEKKRIMEAGFLLHHSKPFEPDLLIKEIIEIVKQAEKSN